MERKQGMGGLGAGRAAGQRSRVKRVELKSGSWFPEGFAMVPMYQVERSTNQQCPLLETRAKPGAGWLVLIKSRWSRK